MYQYWCHYYGGVCHHNTDNINNDTHIGTRYVILAKHWIWLPDDDFIWTETCCSSFYTFNYFNNLRILKFVCISWTIKCLILLMHGANVKFNFTLHLHMFWTKVPECRPLREPSEYKCGNYKTGENCSTRNFPTHILHETRLWLL